MRVFVFLISLLLASQGISQQKLEGSFPFQSDPSKKFSLYVPSSYDESQPNALMLAFHPYNPAKWSGYSWRNELTDFAEENGLLLVCPDGGSDGSVDDQIDYDFTTALMDSMRLWYNVNEEKIFAIGFSVGGKAMYEYGLANASEFDGFIPIGPAINGTTEVQGLLSNAICKPFYLIHGENDAPSVRYEPIKTALEQNKAEVNSILMAGVGHTISFPNRESILKIAYRWIDTVQCKTKTGISEAAAISHLGIYPSPVSKGLGTVLLELNDAVVNEFRVEVYNIRGGMVYSRAVKGRGENYRLPVSGLERGVYLIKVVSASSVRAGRLVIQ